MSSLRESMSRVRTEVQQRIWRGSADKTEPITFTDDLVTGKIEQRDSLKHQRDVAQKDSVAKYIVIKIAENTLDDGFRLVKKIGDDEEIMPEATKALKRLDFKRWYTEALISERMHGNGWIYTGPNKYRQDWTDAGIEGGQVANLDAFTAMNAKVMIGDVTDKGVPTFVTVWYNPANKGATHRLPYKDFIPIVTRPVGRSPIKGYPATYAVWTELTYIRISKHALNFAHGKWGLGLFLWWTKGKLTGDIKTQIETTLKAISASRAATVNSDDIEKVEWTGPTAGGTTDIAQGIDMYLGLVSAGTGIPKDILTGISAGAITGSEINNKALYATLNQVQKSIEPFIRELIRRMGYNGDYEIDWNTRYATDEMEQAQIRVLNTQADEGEQRIKDAKEGKGPNDIAIGFERPQDQEEPKDQEKNRNMAGVQ